MEEWSHNETFHKVAQPERSDAISHDGPEARAWFAVWANDLGTWDVSEMKRGQDRPTEIPQGNS